MTLQELLARVETHPFWALAYFALPPALAWLAGRAHPKGWVYGSPVRYLYTAAIYLACLPGMVAAIALGDTLAHGRLLQAGVLSELAPLLAMLVTLGLVRHQAQPEHIPGFRRITGFMLLLALAAVGVFLLMKTRIWIVFGGGIGTLLVALAALFFLLKWAFERAFGPGR